MPNTPTKALAALALTALPACVPAAGTGPVPTPLPTASAVPSAPATPAADPSPSALPPAASPAWQQPPCCASAPAPGGSTVILSGSVVDEDGAGVDEALVTIRSLDASVPYQATALTDAGSWVVNNVPDGTLIEVTVTKAGWTSRSRVGTFQRQAAVRNTLDFGGPGAPAHFLSNRPEVASTEPAPGADLAGAAYVLHLSEPLSEDDADRFEDALRVWPAEAAAAPAAGAPAAYADLSAGNADVAAGAFDWALTPGQAFFGQKPTLTWNAAHDAATLAFPLPLGARKDGRMRYQVGLVAPDRAIEDPDGHALGQASGRGQVLTQVFRRPEATQAGWAATHVATRAFTVPADARPPQLRDVQTSRPNGDLRLTLTFDEPLAAFDGRTGGRRDPSLAFVATGDPAQVAATGDPLAFLTFALDTTTIADLDDDARPFDPRPAGATLPADGRTYRFAAAALAASPRRADLRPGTDDGTITAVLDPNDPRRLHVEVYRRAGLLAAGRSFRVRVEGLADPAGNRIGAAEADATARTIAP